MVHARATIRPRCLRLPLPPVATSSCRLPCRRLASSSAALAVKPVQSTPLDGLCKVRRLPSLKPAAQVVRSTVKGSSRVGSETRPPTPPARLESGSSSSSGRPTGHSSSERVRAAEARAQPEPLQRPADDVVAPALSPDQERDLRALAELSEESRLLASVKKKALRKYEDAFWRSHMTGTRKPPPRIELILKAAHPVVEPAPRSPEPQAPPSAPPKPTPKAAPPRRTPPVFRFHDHLSHYAALGFSAADFTDLPSDQELKLARVRLQAEAHPDLPGGDVERSSRINQAYDALSSLDKRKRYQAKGTRVHYS